MSSPDHLTEILSEYRIAESSRGGHDSRNTLIQGENLVVLDKLRELGNPVRCAYIDPPYNNQESYEHYDDVNSHEEWLANLKQRIRIIFDLLRKDGSLWISIDDRGMHHLKIACDDILGRENFVSTIVWEHRKSRENRNVFSFNHEYILVYAKDYDTFCSTRNQIPLNDEVLKRYRNPDDDPRGPWQSVSANVQAGHAVDSQFYEIEAPNGKTHTPPKGRCWAYNKERMEKEIEEGNIYFGKDGNGVPRIKKFLKDADKGLTPHTLWKAEKVETSSKAKKHILDLFPEEPPFDTPKPEKLIARILRIASDPGDLVLDAYLGSGTTAAVAHKLRRNYIGIEKGEHATTLCAKRISKVIDGEGGGISEEVDWTGGGNFKIMVPASQAVAG
jgi:adenine-specific DNA-methyltransferase